jgi:hypothetical protein
MVVSLKCMKRLVFCCWQWKICIAVLYALPTSYLCLEQVNIMPARSAELQVALLRDMCILTAELLHCCHVQAAESSKVKSKICYGAVPQARRSRVRVPMRTTDWTRLSSCVLRWGNTCSWVGRRLDSLYVAVAASYHVSITSFTCRVRMIYEGEVFPAIVIYFRSASIKSCTLIKIYLPCSASKICHGSYNSKAILRRVFLYGFWMR